MNGLALQIDGKWAVLGEDVSVSVEGNSPIWGEGNSFSLPFELDVEANRHILGNSDQITGQSVYEVLDGKRAILYTLGIPVYYGIIKLDDEVEIDEGTVDITLVSGNLTFEEMIEGMNCQDVELLDRIVVGEGVSRFEGQNKDTMEIKTFYFPEEMMRMGVGAVSKVNVTEPYPEAKYCNARIAYQLPEKPEEQNEASKLAQKEETELLNKLDIKKGEIADYLVLDADRPLSGLCFFVLYFFDCLFAKLGVIFDSSKLSKVEDMNRLAFFTTRCSCDIEDAGDYYTRSSDVKNIVPSFFASGDDWFWKRKYYKSLYVANSKNFPNVEVSEVVDSMKAGFGIRFVHDVRSNTAKAIYVKDVLTEPGVIEIPTCSIYETKKIENCIKGFKIQYSEGGDNTSFVYDDWKNVNTEIGYSDIKKSVTSDNKVLYIDNATGDAYRIKVDEDAKTEKELNPTLVEFAEFIPVEYGDCSEDGKVEIVDVPFTPIIQNDVYNKEGDEQTFATFLDLSMQYPSFVPFTWYKILGTTFESDQGFRYSYFSAQRSSGDTGTSITYLNVGEKAVKKEYSNNLFDYDAGLTFGVMRGPGREAGTEEFDENYDGEGNSKYAVVAQDYTFHSDIIDNYGRLFDYNGTEAGGVDISGRFSLKLKAEKPVPESFKELGISYEDYYNEWKEWELSDEEIKASWDTLVSNTEYYKKNGYFPITETYAQKRGLFDKFYTEYAYFVVNRKIVRMKCRMEMADILNIDWTKRYKIGDYIGFINKYSYTINAEGMSDVELEMYYI